MNNFSIIFYEYIHSKTDSQLQIINKICSELEIDPTEWFNKFRKRDCPDYSGTRFLDEMLSNFIFYLSREFEKPLYKYFPPQGYNIYNEPYLSLYLDLSYNLETGFHAKKGVKKFRKMMKMINLVQKQDLMTNKLFSQIVNQTKLKIYSKKDIRYLKLKKINEYDV